MTSSGGVMSGAVVSFTVTKNSAFAVLPALSEAAMSTPLSPRGKVEPEGGVTLTLGDESSGSATV